MNLDPDEVTEKGDFKEQLQKMKTHPGFIAALDQSGGSTPNALRAYGIKENAWSNEEEMFAIVHQMRTRIMTSPFFTGERILAAILFENTVDRDVEGQPTADYLWNVKRVVPFLKVDKGLAAEKSGVQLMKPMPELSALLDKAKAKRIFGTKMRSFVKQANGAGIKDIVAQQFEVARQIIAADLVPIVEPEVDIHCLEKAKAEDLLKAAILEELKRLPVGQLVMLKLTLPEKDDLYAEFVAHPKVVRVVALSILAADFARLGQQVAEAEQGGADRIHVDVMDGHFVPNLSMGSAIVESLRRVTQLPLEIHLMISDPDSFLDEFAAAGSDSFLVHWEGNNNLHGTVQRIRTLGKRVAVAINPATPSAVLEEIVHDLDQVLVMTVNPGFGHQQFIRTTLPKIERVRELTEGHKPGCDVEVDGGIDATTAPLVVRAGATVLVAGSAIFGDREGVVAAMKRLRTALDHTAP